MSQFFRRLMIVVLALPIVPWLVAPAVTHAEEASIVDHVVLRSAELDGMWAQYMAAAGHTYVTPWVVVVLPQHEGGAAGWYSENVVLASEPVDSSWGGITSDRQGGSFYDFHTHTIYLTYNDMTYQWGNFGDFSVSFLIAHEWGHHISNLVYQPDFGSLYNASYANKTFFELQADCYVGLYTNVIGALGGLEAGDVEEAYYWAGAIGSDVGGNLDPATWTHGSSAQRMASFWHGYSTNQCEAYSGLSGAPLTTVQAADCQNPIAVPCDQQGLERADSQTTDVWPAGWYDPYGYGCQYWYDGTQYTEYVDCNGDGLADTTDSSTSAGWYGPYNDGCNYWWDGTQWTGHVDCDGDGYADPMSSGGGADCQNPIAMPCDEQDGTGSSGTAGWYGPYADGCNYWWDGAQWTGHVDCDNDGNADTGNSYAGWYGPYEDGCNYWWDGTQWTVHIDCNGDGQDDRTGGGGQGGADCQNPIAVPCDQQGGSGVTTTAGWYGPYSDGCNYWWDGTQWTGHVDCDGDGYYDA